jgi:hypothetical protein
MSEKKIGMTIVITGSDATRPLTIAIAKGR